MRTRSVLDGLIHQKYGDFVVFFLEKIGMFTIWLWHVMTNSSRTGKIHHAIDIGKPSISIRAIYTMANC